MILAWDRIVSSPNHLIARNDLAEELGHHVVEALVRSQVVALHPVTLGWEVLDGYGKPDKDLISAGSVPNLLVIKKMLGEILRASPKAAGQSTFKKP